MWIEDELERFGQRSIGWLDGEHDFPTGQVSAEFFERLTELARDPFEPFSSMGFHECEVCQFPEARNGRNMFIPGDGFIFVSPAMIVHYVAAHSYRPPDEFITAVMACPDMRTTAYRKAFLANGGRELMKPPLPKD